MKSRKRKEHYRKTIRTAMSNGDIDSKNQKYIHFIIDDFYYWMARTAWEKLHNQSYKDHYSKIANDKKRLRKQSYLKIR